MLIKDILHMSYQDRGIVVRSGRYYGLEIETEGRNLPEYIGEDWRIVDDGSLRKNPMAWEYVSRNPIPYKDREEHLRNFRDNTQEAVFKISHRCSVHVHRNVMHLTPDRVFKVISLYSMFEPALSAWCGKSRQGNRFCLRSVDSQVLLSWIGRALFENLSNLRADIFKYSAVNIATIPRLGTLEFRALEGTVDTDRILKWIDIIECLFKFSVQVDQMGDVVEEFYADPKALVKKVFGKFSEELFPSEGVYSECEYSTSLNINMIDWDIRISKKYSDKEAEKQEGAIAFKKGMNAEAEHFNHFVIRDILDGIEAGALMQNNF